MTDRRVTTLVESHQGASALHRAEVTVPRRSVLEATARHHADDVRGGLAALSVGPMLLIAAGFVAVELIVAARYGYHRDELYFLACAKHLAWGYVDQPPLVPAVARISTALFGSSAFALRAFPACAGGVAVVLTSLMARELGGRRHAQIIAALSAATSALVLATAHLLSTAAFDLMFWAAITLLVLRLRRTGDARWWLAVGAVAGAGLLNKYNVAFLIASLVGGLVVTGGGRQLLNRWAGFGAAIALAMVLPNIIWNIGHHWAALSMLRSLHQENATLRSSLTFIPALLLFVGPVLAPIWIAGLRRLLADPVGRPFAVAFLVLVAIDTAAGAKPYYLGGLFCVLFAAGGVAAAERFAAWGRRGALFRKAAWMVAGSAVLLPLTLPVLPVAALAKGSWEGELNKDLSATVGWDRVAHQIGDIVAALPPAQRAGAVVFTEDYGAAGAVDRFGARYGLRGAVSGHNNYWWWGPTAAADGATTVAVNFDRAYLETLFATVTPAGTVDTGHGVWTEERGAPIYVCRGQKLPWRQLWPRARHYG